MANRRQQLQRHHAVHPVHQARKTITAFAKPGLAQFYGTQQHRQRARGKARHAEDVRSIPTQDGLVQQFVFVITTPTGERKAWALCVVVKIKDGLITRVDEYIDRAGGFDVGDGDVTTPGF